MNAENKFCVGQLVTNYEVVCAFESATHRCSAVDPKVIMGEPSMVLSLAAIGCMGVL